MSDSATSAVGLERTRRFGVATFARDHAWETGLCAAMAVWTVVLFGIVHESYVTFRLGRFDLGNMTQAVWSTAHGHPFEITNGHTGEQMVRLGGHVDPILAVFVPIWLVAPSPLTLAAAQVVAVALGAVPLFLLARRHLGVGPASLLALAYLAYPWVAWTAVDAMHPVTFAIPLYLFCVWALDSDRLLVFAVCAVLAAATGELMAFPIAALGIWYAFACCRRKAGAVIAVTAVTWVAIALAVVVPAFSGGASVFYSAYSQVGSSPEGVVRTAVTDPLRILAEATQGGDLLYLFLLAVPVGGLFVLAPGLAAVALPQLAANLLADVRWTTDPHSHYIAAVVPFLFASICLGLSRVSEKGRFRGALLVLTLCVAATLMAGPWPGAPGNPVWHTSGGPVSPAHVRALREAVSLVPDGAAVSSTGRVGAQLASRRYLYSVPVIRRATWIVLDSTDAWMPQAVAGHSDPKRLGAFRSAVEHNPAWRRVFAKDGVLVFRKVRP